MIDAFSMQIGITDNVSSADVKLAFICLCFLQKDLNGGQELQNNIPNKLKFLIVNKDILVAVAVVAATAAAVEEVIDTHLLLIQYCHY